MLSVPATACTLDGFREWVLSDEFPEDVRASFIDRELLVESYLFDDDMLSIPVSAGTLAGFVEWVTSDAFPKGIRASLIEKELLFDMSPEEINIHNRLKTEITFRIRQLIESGMEGEVYSDRALLVNPAADLSTEPDALFSLWKTLESARLRLQPRANRPGESTELRGTPDWVLEIVSRTSQRKDKKILRAAYHKAGIPEYWLIDAVRDPVVFHLLRHEPHGYEPVAEVDGWTRSPLFKHDFKLQRKRDPLGNWRYTLASRPV